MKPQDDENLIKNGAALLTRIPKWKFRKKANLFVNHSIEAELLQIHDIRSESKVKITNTHKIRIQDWRRTTNTNCKVNFPNCEVWKCKSVTE